MKLTNKIQKKLISFVQSNPYDIVIPNFYIDSTECDLFKLTKSGMCVEYEIKISKSDFKADFEKRNLIGTNKHNIIEKGLRVNRFFFVIPEKLLEYENIPKYCGIIVYNEKYDSMSVYRSAKILTKNNLAPSYVDLCMKLSFRESSARNKRRWAEYVIMQNKKRIDLLEKILKENNLEIPFAFTAHY